MLRRKDHRHPNKSPPPPAPLQFFLSFPSSSKDMATSPAAAPGTGAYTEVDQIQLAAPPRAPRSDNDLRNRLDQRRANPAGSASALDTTPPRGASDLPPAVPAPPQAPRISALRRLALYPAPSCATAFDRSAAAPIRDSFRSSSPSDIDSDQISVALDTGSDLELSASESSDSRSPSTPAAAPQHTSSPPPARTTSRRQPSADPAPTIRLPCGGRRWQKPPVSRRQPGPPSATAGPVTRMGPVPEHPGCGPPG